MAELRLTAPASLRVSKHYIPAHERIPNTSIQNKPLLIYRDAFPDSGSASRVEAHLKEVGVVQPQWRYTMYKETHYHSTTHEVLCVASGAGKLCFGGEENPDKVETSVKQGDVIIIPAGVGHRLIEVEEGTFEMVGSYPVGSKEWDMCYGKHGEEAKVATIKKLAWFREDPVYGSEGPVLDC